MLHGKQKKNATCRGQRQRWSIFVNGLGCEESFVVLRVDDGMSPFSVVAAAIENINCTSKIAIHSARTYVDKTTSLNEGPATRQRCDERPSGDGRADAWSRKRRGATSATRDLRSAIDRAYVKVKWTVLRRLRR